MTAPFTSPLRISPNGRYFVTAEGEPFFWMGDTAWPFFVRYPMQVALDYLAKRASQGFTVVQGVLAWSAGTGFEAPNPAANEDGHSAWTEDPPPPKPPKIAPGEKKRQAAQ
jgi:hypothetical protein